MTTESADKTGVRYGTIDGIAQITLDAPPVNILTASLMRNLRLALARANEDASLKAILITAEGRAFSAGADVGEHAPEQAPVMIGEFGALFQLLGACRLPLVMAVDGAALGAGFELAMMADILIASDRATFGQPEIRLGFFAPVALAALPARIGLPRTLEITCTGRTWSADEMAAMGLVSRVVPHVELGAAVESVLADMRRASPAVMRLNVSVARRIAGQPFEEARREAERAFLDELMKLEDVREGISSFYEKRRPQWRNR